MNAWDSQCCVIGAGVVGLAVARRLATAGFEVVVVEQESRIGSHTSSRNSEVIHAGLYYSPNSLKALHCRRGRDALYEFCDVYSVPYSRCGKLIVATGDEQKAQLGRIRERAETNGVYDLELVDQAALRELEPELQCTTALLSPSTGIIDSHAFMLALQGDLERHGGILVCNSQVTNATRSSSGHYLLQIRDANNSSEPPTTLTCRYLINASGLFAAQLLRQLEVFPESSIPSMSYAKGNYFRLNRKAPFSHLIYPVPEAGGLGVHLTLDLAGSARFGPDVEWLAPGDISQPDYRVDSTRVDSFYSAVQKYWPGLQKNDLTADYCGIRPKVVSRTSDNDFKIQTECEHGLPGWINLLGIESPGLTASLSLADEVCTIIRGQSRT